MSGRVTAGTLCKHGKSCNLVNSSMGCTYIHPAADMFCPRSTKCNLANSGCMLKHPKSAINCRRGSGCRVEACRYKHQCERGDMCRNRGRGKPVLVAKPRTHDLMWVCCLCPRH